MTWYCKFHDHMHGNITLATTPPDCSACAIGTYKDAANNSACTTCPSLTSTQTTTSTAATDCLCNPGYFRNDTLGTCAECPRHTYKPILSDSACTACTTPNAHTFTTGNTDASACVCGPGYGLYNPDTTRVCRPCPLDTYQNGTTNSSCNTCLLPNAATLSTGTTTSDHCVCGPGYGLPSDNSSTVCELCPLHTYQAGAVNGPCTLCEAPNAFTLEPGQTEHSGCVCGPGYEKPNPTSEYCEHCPLGKYQPNITNGTCVACPTGTYALEHGAINVSFCDCDRNYEGDGGLTCEACALGKIKTVQGNFPDECRIKNCDDDNADLSPLSGNCECAKGYDNASATSCQACQPGFFKDALAAQNTAKYARVCAPTR